jgi:hypothetical protein
VQDCVDGVMVIGCGDVYRVEEVNSVDNCEVFGFMELQ